MSDHFRHIELHLPFDEFRQLPRSSAYKYEYYDGRAVLTPRPKGHRAVLDLRPIPDVEPYDLRPLPADEVVGLTGLFAGAFNRTQPFASLPDADARTAARACLERTASGGDGPLIAPACLQAFEKLAKRPIGAILVTLLPMSIVENEGAWRWAEPPPPDAVERRLGCPHLTWVFVSPWNVRHGAGTALLAAAVQALLDLGYTQLASTFLLGNDSSTLWHWRNGFRLQPLFGAFRRIAKKYAAKDENAPGLG